MTRPTKKVIPEFVNEAEERKFWESAENDTSEYFDDAKSVKVTFPRLKPTTTAISLRLPQSVLDNIKTQANKLDVPYQSLMKVWLSEKLSEHSS